MKRIYNLQTVLPHVLIGLLLIFVAYMGSAQIPESIVTSANDIGKSYTAGTRIITGLPKYFPDTVKNETLFAMDKNNNRLFTWNPKSSRWEVDKIRGNSSSTPRMEVLNSLVFDYTNTILQDSNNFKYYRWDLTANIWNTGLNGSDTLTNYKVFTPTIANVLGYKEIYSGATLPASATIFQTGNKFLLTTDSTEYTYQGNHVWFSNIVKGTATPLQKVVSGSETFDNSRAVWKNPLSSITVDFVYRGSVWQPQKGYLDVVDFGANTAYVDNSLYFQAAINYAAYTNSFSKVVIPQGIYNIASPIYLKSYISLIGENRTKTVINANTGFSGRAMILLDTGGLGNTTGCYGFKINNFTFSNTIPATAIADARLMVVGGEISDISYSTHNFIDLLNNPTTSSSAIQYINFGAVSTYTQGMSIKNIGGIGSNIDKIIHLSGNFNHIENLDQEGTAGSSYDPLIFLDNSAGPNTGQGNTFIHILVEPGMSINKIALKCVNLDNVNFQDIWFEFNNSSDTVIYFKNCGVTNFQFASNVSLSAVNPNKYIQLDNSNIYLPYFRSSSDGTIINPLQKMFRRKNSTVRIGTYADNYFNININPIINSGDFIIDEFLNENGTDTTNLKATVNTIQSTQNLLYNGDFEKQTTGWIKTFLNSQFSDTVGFANIGKCVKITSIDATSQVMNQGINITADMINMPLTFNGKVKVLGSGWASVTFAGAGVNSLSGGNSRYYGNNTWFDVTRTIVPNTVGILYVEVDVFAADNTTRIYVDNFSIGIGKSAFVTSKNSDVLFNDGHTINYTTNTPTWTGKAGDVSYNSNGINPSYYQFDGTSWISNVTNNWQTTGNTTTGSNFLGTTNAQDLIFKTNNTEQLRISSANGNVGVGTTTPAYKLDVVGGDVRINTIKIGLGSGNIQSNIAVGAFAGNNNTTGSNNLSVGYGAGYYNTTGQYNLALGTSALQNNTIGIYNAAVGGLSLLNNTASFNTSFGYQSGINNTTGANNEFLGFNTGYNNITGSNNLYVGYNAGSNNISGSSNTYIGVQNTGIINESSRSNLLVLGTNANGAYIVGDSTGSIGIGTKVPAYKLDVLSSANPIRLTGLQAGASTDLIITSASGVLRTQTAAQVVQNGITKTSVTSTFTVPSLGEYLIPFTLTGTTQASIVAATYIATDVTGCSFSIPFLAGDGTGTVKVINRTASAVTFTSLKVNFAVLSY